jgi:hypothetical protein
MAGSALLAQWVEHLHGKEGVDGSSPSEGSYEIPATRGVSFFLRATRFGAGRTRVARAPARAFRRLLPRHPLSAIELVEDVPVGVERHRRGVSRLPGDLHDRTTLRDQE